MKTSIYKGILVPAGMLSAFIIGAGVFSLPYLFYHAGIAVGFAYLAVFGVVLSVIHMMYAEIIESTPGEHRFVGFARIYFGRTGFSASFVTTVIGILLTLLVYLALSAEFIKLITPVGDSWAFAFFWIVSTIPVLLGITKIGDYSLPVSLAMMLIAVIIFFYGAPNLARAETPVVNIANFYLPYAAVLFSLSGRSAISAVRTYFKANRLSLKTFYPAILIGTLAPVVVYSLFVLGVLGLSGDKVSIDAASGMIGSPWSVIFSVAVFGLLSIWTSYVFLGIELKGILSKDLRFHQIATALSVAILPAFLYLVGLNSLIFLIGIVGGVLLAAESVLVILIWCRIKKRRPALLLSSAYIILIFVLGGAHEILRLF